MVMVFEDKLDFTKMTVSDGALLKANVWTEIAEYQVPVGELRFWGFTQRITDTQSLVGSIKATIKDNSSTPVALNDNAMIRLVIKNTTKSLTFEVWRGKYGDIKNSVQLPLQKPGAMPYRYLAVEIMLPAGASGFTFSQANSSIDISTTVVQE